MKHTPNISWDALEGIDQLAKHLTELGFDWDLAQQKGVDISSSTGWQRGITMAMGMKPADIFHQVNVEHPYDLSQQEIAEEMWNEIIIHMEEQRECWLSPEVDMMFLMVNDYNQIAFLTLVDLPEDHRFLDDLNVQWALLETPKPEDMISLADLADLYKAEDTNQIH